MADEKQMDQVAPISPEAQENPQLGVTHARETAEDLHSAAGAMAAEYRVQAEPVLDNGRRRVFNLENESEQYVRENPTKAVFIALCAGFLFGFTFRR
jgi:ElaB/YqjD/DUF883 family membrane-anchored ribosome-binding protein